MHPAVNNPRSAAHPHSHGPLTTARMLQSHADIIPVAPSTQLPIDACVTLHKRHVIRIVLINKEEASSASANTHDSADDPITWASQSFRVSKV